VTSHIPTVDTSPDREIGPRGTLRKPTTQRTPPAPKLEVDIRVSIIEFHRWQVTDDNSALTWGPVQPGDVQNIRLSDLIEHGPLTCVQMLRERGATDARSIRGLDGLQSRYEFRWIHVPGLVGSWAEVGNPSGHPALCPSPDTNAQPTSRESSGKSQKR
jgi:hypothetical protein